MRSKRRKIDCIRVERDGKYNKHTIPPLRTKDRNRMKRNSVEWFVNKKKKYNTGKVEGK